MEAVLRRQLQTRARGGPKRWVVADGGVALRAFLQQEGHVPGHAPRLTQVVAAPLGQIAVEVLPGARSARVHDEHFAHVVPDDLTRHHAAGHDADSRPGPAAVVAMLLADHALAHRVAAEGTPRCAREAAVRRALRVKPAAALRDDNDTNASQRGLVERRLGEFGAPLGYYGLQKPWAASHVQRLSAEALECGCCRAPRM